MFFRACLAAALSGCALEVPRLEAAPETIVGALCGPVAVEGPTAALPVELSDLARIGGPPLPCRLRLEAATRLCDARLDDDPLLFGPNAPGRGILLQESAIVFQALPGGGATRTWADDPERPGRGLFSGGDAWGVFILEAYASAQGALSVLAVEQAAPEAILRQRVVPGALGEPGGGETASPAPEPVPRSPWNARRTDTPTFKTSQGVCLIERFREADDTQVAAVWRVLPDTAGPMTLRLPANADISDDGWYSLPRADGRVAYVPIAPDCLHLGAPAVRPRIEGVYPFRRADFDDGLVASVWPMAGAPPGPPGGVGLRLAVSEDRVETVTFSLPHSVDSQRSGRLTRLAGGKHLVAAGMIEFDPDAQAAGLLILVLLDAAGEVEAAAAIRHRGDPDSSPPELVSVATAADALAEALLRAKGETWHLRLTRECADSHQ